MTNIPQDIYQFLENLLKEANTLPVDDKLKETMIDELYPRLEERLNLTLVDNLNEQQQNAYLDLLKSQPGQAQIQEFIKENVPNLAKIYQKTLAEFKSLYVKSAGS